MTFKSMMTSAVDKQIDRQIDRSRKKEAIVCHTFCLEGNVLRTLPHHEQPQQ